MLLLNNQDLKELLLPPCSETDLPEKQPGIQTHLGSEIRTFIEWLVV